MYGVSQQPDSIILTGPKGALAEIIPSCGALLNQFSIHVDDKPFNVIDGFADPAKVHRLDHVRGPERITGQWWQGRSKTRDYFDVLDTAGNRYWIFRVAETGGWFLHGIFA